MSVPSHCSSAKAFFHSPLRKRRSVPVTPRGRHQERKGQIGRGVVQHAGRIGHHHAALAGLRHIDVVVPTAMLFTTLTGRTRVKNAASNRSVKTRQDTIVSAARARSAAGREFVAQIGSTENSRKHIHNLRKHAEKQESSSIVLLSRRTRMRWLNTRADERQRVRSIRRE